MQEKFFSHIVEGLHKIDASCNKSPQDPGKLGMRVGRVLQQNSRAAALFDIKIDTDEKGHGCIQWHVKSAEKEWARLNCGCYLLRSNLLDWEPDDLWKAYMQLTRRKRLFGSINKTSAYARSGTSVPIASNHTSWCAFWLTWSGRRWACFAARRALATSPAKYWKSSSPSVLWMSCCPPQPA